MHEWRDARKRERKSGGKTRENNNALNEALKKQDCRTQPRTHMKCSLCLSRVLQAVQKQKKDVRQNGKMWKGNENEKEEQTGG